MNTAMRFLLRRRFTWVDLVSMGVLAAVLHATSWYIWLTVLILLSFGITFLERRYDRSI